jgi:hypothetical protein
MLDRYAHAGLYMPHRPDSIPTQESLAEFYEKREEQEEVPQWPITVFGTLK